MRSRGRLVGGVVAISLGLVAAIAGAALLTTFGVDGAYDARSRLVTDSSAFVFDALSIGGVPIDGVTLDVEATASVDVFVGIGPAEDVATFLDGVAFERIVRIDPEGPFRLEEEPGTRAATPPSDVTWWSASAEGTDATMTWPVEAGSWALVVMRGDGGPAIDAEVAARLAVPGAGPAGIVLAVGALALLVGGAALTIASARPR
jgi:hypothetical protein